MAQPAPLFISAQEYLRRERLRQDGRAELVNGEIYAMAGASRRHNRIVSSLDVLLNLALKDTRCEALVADMRVKVSETGMYTYPDVVVTCEPEFEDEHEDTLLNPVVIFEVLSPSTQNYDRGDKFAHYRRIPSLKHYVLVGSEEQVVDHYARKTADQWLLTSYRNPSDVLSLDPPGVRLSLEAIYQRLNDRG